MNLADFIKCNCGGSLGDDGKCKKCGNQCIKVQGNATITVVPEKGEVVVES